MFRQTPMPAALTANFPVLIVGSHAAQDSAVGRSVGEIVETLRSLGRPVVVAYSLDDAEAAA